MNTAHAEPAALPFEGWFAVSPAGADGSAFWAAWWTREPSGSPWTTPDATGTSSRGFAAADADSAIRRARGRGARARQLHVAFAEAAERQARGEAPAFSASPKAAPAPASRRSRRRRGSSPTNHERARAFWEATAEAIGFSTAVPTPSAYGFSLEPPFPPGYTIADYIQGIRRGIWEEIAKAWADARRGPASGSARVEAVDKGAAALESFGLSRPCSAEDVRRAFRREVAHKKLHPDQGGDGAAFKLLAARCAMAIAYVEQPAERRRA